MNFLKKLFKRKKDEKSKALPDWKTVTEIMSKEVPRYSAYEIIRIEYCRDKSLRYIILRSNSGYLTYRFERLFGYDKDEMELFPDSLPGYWAEADSGVFHIFDNMDELMFQLVSEPEYITAFGQDKEEDEYAENNMERNNKKL